MPTKRSSPSTSSPDPAGAGAEGHRGSADLRGESADTFVLPDTSEDHPDRAPRADDETTVAGGSEVAALSLEGERAGAYRLESYLAGGGFGEVYRARGPEGEIAAVKVLRAELAATRESISRFEREVDAIARVSHPNVVRVLDRGRVGGDRPYFAMELLDGWSLADRLEARGAMPAREAAAVLDRLADALAAAHARGIVHRDIKASNVFLAGPEERVVLLDFGVAKLLDEVGPALTRSRQLVGTPACMAPEQLAGEGVTPRTDVYALGVLAYHMLTGARPFSGDSPAMLQHLHRNARRPRPSAKIALPAAVDRAVVAAMAVDPGERFADARAFAEAFGAPFAAADERAAEPARASASAVRVDADPRDRSGLDPGALGALSDAMTAAEDRLRAAGFEVVTCLGRTLLAAKPAPAGAEADRHEAENLAREIEGESTASVRVVAGAQIGAATVADGRVTGGPVCALGAEGRGPLGDAPAGDAPAGDAPAGDAPAGDAPAGDAPDTLS